MRRILGVVGYSLAIVACPLGVARFWKESEGRLLLGGVTGLGGEADIPGGSGMGTS